MIENDLWSPLVLSILGHTASCPPEGQPQGQHQHSTMKQQQPQGLGAHGHLGLGTQQPVITITASMWNVQSCGFQNSLADLQFMISSVFCYWKSKVSKCLLPNLTPSLETCVSPSSSLLWLAGGQLSSRSQSLWYWCVCPCLLWLAYCSMTVVLLWCSVVYITQWELLTI